MRQRYDLEWDNAKNLLNQEKHGASFEEARQAFDDDQRVIVRDRTHSTPVEERYYCIAQVDRGVITVRFTYRSDRIRIIGAGFWRQGRKIYEERNG